MSTLFIFQNGTFPLEMIYGEEKRWFINNNRNCKIICLPYGRFFVEVKNENMKQNAKTDKVLIHRLKESKTKKAVELLWKEINKKVRVYLLL